MDTQSPKPRWWTRLLHRPGWLIALAVCLLLTAVLVPFGWRYYRTQQLVAGIEACGGAVNFELGGPTWLRNIVGDEWMKPFDAPNHVSSFRLVFDASTPSQSRNSSWTPRETLGDDQFLDYILPLNDLVGIKSLELTENDLTQLSFEKLGQFEQLEVLVLWDKAFDDDALSHFSKSYKLRSLDLSGTSVTDEGLRHLSGLKDLTDLSLSNTDVTDEGVSELQRHLPGLDVSDD
ncbi:Leucine Rich repeats (2 copies) [Symmachiella dynata]|uniref:Leucine Rich repeats (2 copies) n=1 Tax=Symmachiella dynata TaxID=2527995 RepID=A0A517ZV98_9PLAN|nr:hypothetical protein [Symmachiella dynata]QDU46356.1 Leucine Rich repeats (2 copies) [Symmachiella dynata]